MMKFIRNWRAFHSANAKFARERVARRPWMALLVFLLLVAPAQTRIARAALGSQDGASNLRPFTDEAGRQLRIPAGLKRIVSLAPNLTEIVFVLGEGDRLAGDTNYCDYPPEASLKPHVGGPVNPNLEQIVALKPDVVLATAINRRETVGALARIGVPVYATDPHSVEGMIASLEHIGAVLEAEKTAAPLAASLRERLSTLNRRIAGAAPRRVLFVVWTDPLISIGRDSFIADALRRAGARSVVDAATEWPRISFEEVLRLQPEFLVFANAHAADAQHDIDTLRARPGWRDLDAMRRGDIVIVSDAINRPEPRMVDAIEQLARAFHSDAFASGHGRIALPARLIEEACTCAR